MRVRVQRGLVALGEQHSLGLPRAAILHSSNCRDQYRHKFHEYKCRETNYQAKGRERISAERSHRIIAPEYPPSTFTEAFGSSVKLATNGTCIKKPHWRRSLHPTRGT